MCPLVPVAVKLRETHEWSLAPLSGQPMLAGDAYRDLRRRGHLSR